jgi:DNA-binding CsgD family transcriptional regulator
MEAGITDPPETHAVTPSAVGAPDLVGSSIETTAVIGREPVLSRLGEFLDGSTCCLVLQGEPGIGKTSVWARAIKLARDKGYVVLTSRASEAETGFSFAALSDLAAGAGEAVLAALPAPQLHALEVALRKAHPTGGALDPLAIAAGLHGALRVLSQTAPVLIAIDDVQWLDQASAEPVGFAIRRLAGCDVRILLTKRLGSRSPLDQALQSVTVEEVDVPRLSYGALRQVVWERLGLALPRREFRLLYDTCNGNPLFALEVGRMLAASGEHELGADLPLPRLVEDVFGQRLGELRAEVKLVVLATALTSGLSRAELSRVVDPLALEDAVSDRLVVVERVGEREIVRPSHPLLAAAARRDSQASQRQELHLGLSAAVADEVLRARHLALATTQPDNDVAAVVAAASVMAAERAALREAEELAAHALRLTPDGAAERGERLAHLASCHLDAGDLDRAQALLETRIDEVPPGRERALARVALGEAGSMFFDEHQLELALAEAPDDPEVRELVFERRAMIDALGRVARLAEAEVLAREALSAAGQVGPDAEARALTALAWVLALRGRPFDDVLAGRIETGPSSILYNSAVERPLGVRYAFRGEVEKARSIFLRLAADAFSRGELRMSAMISIQLFELAVRSGNANEAGRLLEELEQWTDVIHGSGLGRRLRAQLYAVIGNPPATAREASGGVQVGESNVDQQWDVLELARAQGLAALYEGNAAAAVDHLCPVWEFTRCEGVDDLGAFPVAGDLVEAYVDLGKLDAADPVVAVLEVSATEQQHPWAAATAVRAGALVRLGRSAAFDEEAASSLRDAALEFRRLGLDFDSSRCLLALGRFERRFRKSGAARRSLEETVSAFDSRGCSGWAALARSELARVPGRRPGATTSLTSGELQVATLAASGHSNKEISAKLFLSVNTVEGHLSKAYGKLGVRSRSQLSARLAEITARSPQE